eukprot:NODE_1097_length_1469_cov_98.586438_g1086_i0.p1 GENE.NODE_1097_length_1469_cov_98.586438_g1086_i0~~NODE_1097_length_1469_cov_98.586438_g1086_i0.p1  ORF type:complete len:430 (-),score=73.28 NODE_1097_length_1469_cov_98.586438_g1086_i0:100-1389(-)
MPQPTEPLLPLPSGKHWHSLKGKYKRLIAESRRNLVEHWYNKIAPTKHRKSFHEVVQRIFESNTTAPDTKVFTDTANKARVLFHHYGRSIINDQYKEKVIGWLASATSAGQDQFRAVFSSISAAIDQLAPLTQHTLDFPEYPPQPPVRTVEKKLHPTFVSRQQQVRQYLEKQDAARRTALGLDDPSADQGGVSASAADGILFDMIASRQATRSLSAHAKLEGKQSARVKKVQLSAASEAGTSQPRACTADGADGPRAPMDREAAHQLAVLHLTNGPRAVRGAAALTDDDGGFVYPGWLERLNVADAAGEKGLLAKPGGLRRFQPPWNNKVSIQNAIQQQGNQNYCLSKPVRQIQNVKTPWSNMALFLQAASTNNLESYKYIPVVAAEKYGNAGSADANNTACNPQHTASFGAIIPSLQVKRKHAPPHPA